MKQRFVQQQVPTKDMVAYYKLWYGLTTAGEVFDYSLNGNLGTVTGAVPAYPGLLFDASDDEINCGSDSSIDDLFAGGGTFACWFLSSGRGETSSGRVADKGQWQLFSVTDTTTLEFDQAFTGDPGEWTFSITAGVWQHVAIVYNNNLGANDPTIYINGVSVNVTEAQAPGSDTATSDAASDLIIGDNAGSSTSWDGKIGDTMLFNVALIAADVKSIFEITRRRYNV